ncbi:MAG: AMP-binding protein [Candidatus Lokiarchaeota archaeon]|nr:AMP-binding protein [Candidatus Lokiarchaeota archaeon]
MGKLGKFIQSVNIKAKYYPEDRLAIIYGDEHVTWKELMTNTNKMANGLKKLGIKKGDKVAFCFYNSPQFLETNLGVQELGAIPVPMNFRYVAPEMKFLLNNSDAKVFIFHEDMLPELLEIREEIPNVEYLIHYGENTPEDMIDYNDFLDENKEKLIKVPVSVDDTAVIIYTGGTTGRPKGVMLSYDNILSNEEAAMAFLAGILPPVEELDLDVYAKNEFQRRVLEANTTSLSGIPEVFFEQNPDLHDKVIVVEQPAKEGTSFPAMTYAMREGKLKPFLGKPPEDKYDGLVHMAVANQMRDLANLKPLTYHPWGKLKFTLKLLWLMIKGRINVEAKDKKVKKALKKAMRSREEEEEIHKTIMVPPLFHLASYAVFLIAWIFQGATVVFPKSKRFSPEEILEMIEREELKQMFLVPTMWKRVIDHLEKTDKEYDLSSMGVCLTGAAVLRAKYKKKLLKYFENAIVVDAFGQSEMSPVATMKIDGDKDEVKDRSVGVPLIGTDIKVIDDDGNPVPEGEVGELCYKSKAVMQGYYKDADKTSKAIDEEGYLHSGDLGYIKDGEVYIVERKKECINSGGEKIWPHEVEEILYDHPKIDQVAVIGVPDEEWGETVRAVVVPKEGEKLTKEEVIEFVEGKIAGYKKPRSVIFADKFPISPVGKVLRQKIRDKWGQPDVK